ncbi:glycosyltransferase [Ruminococcus sp. OA3]|uniref:glycosyltransferase n=1 Tax=Ruminococcus sp. OA3 TaxID=2914164 RepID=UPI001F067208|nr:glycosyltransferase [Ruminococcus sp. OA3]MCH1982179.1 glycosyltransferase [Ruminococcus sp. OA3]
MSKGSRVSVLMSVYRPDLSFLRQQLLSIEAQDYPDTELIVWDDCPGEDITGILGEILLKTPYTYHRCSENLGYIRAFETLAEMASGEYLAFCDQDDVWDASKLSRCTEVLEQKRAVLVTSDRRIIDEENRVVTESVRSASRHPYERWSTGDDISCNAVFTCYALGMTIVMRTDAAKRMLPFSRNTGHDKWVTMCAAAMGSVCYIEEVLQSYRRHGKNVSGIFYHLASKEEYYTWRVETSCAVVRELLERFPDHPRREQILAFSRARKRRKTVQLWKYRRTAPAVAMFEIMLKWIPSGVFAWMLKHMQGR